ncbi:hypothetical protein [Hoeflea sp.]|uniref:hypothetical protein n=1 Tax=Hoeflea sp. TaxID=1940281 RepID=UPI003B52F0E8
MKTATIIAAGVISLGLAPATFAVAAASGTAEAETTASSVEQSGADSMTRPVATDTQDILADLRANSMSAEEILGVDTVDEIDIVSLESFSGEDLQRLEETLGSTEDGMAEVQTAVTRNQTLEIALDGTDVMISDLVAATRSETGGVTLYIDKPSL